MKLTTEQIQVIAETLDLNGLVYEDMKWELLDHIASEIENKMCLENCSFEETYKAVFENWKEQLRPKTYDFLFGYNLIGPRIIMDKMASNKISELKLIGISVFTILLIIIGVYKFTNNKELLNYFEHFLAFLATGGCVMLLVFKIKFSFSKIKTSHKLRFDNSIISLLLYFIVMRFNAKHSSYLSIDIYYLAIDFLMTLTCIALIFNALNVAYQHFQFEKKYAN